MLHAGVRAAGPSVGVRNRSVIETANGDKGGRRKGARDRGEYAQRTEETVQRAWPASSESQMEQLGEQLACEIGGPNGKSSARAVAGASGARRMGRLRRSQYARLTLFAARRATRHGRAPKRKEQSHALPSFFCARQRREPLSALAPRHTP
eukprot:4041581-Pleurochrysis_carterae.AAC.3